MNTKKIILDSTRITYGVYIVIMVIDSLLSLVVASLLKQIIDSASASDLHIFKIVLVKSVFLMVAVAIVSMSLYIFEANAKKKALTKYKDYIFENLLKKTNYSFKEENMGTYLSGMTNDVMQIETNYLKGTAELVANIFLFFGALFLMIYYSPILTVFTIIFLCVPIVLSLLLGNRLSMEETAVSDWNSHFMDFLQDFLNGFEVIKGFQAEKEVLNIFSKRDKQLEQTKYKKNCVIGGMKTIMAVGGLIPQIGILLVGTYLILTGNNVTVGILVGFTSLLGNFMNPIMSIPQQYSSRKASIALMEKMENALQKNVQSSVGYKLDHNPDIIRMDSVSYAYSDKTVLKDVNLELKSGKAYAFVGLSGSGKSTLIDLISGTYNDYYGVIQYDNRDLREYNKDSIAESISTIRQNVFIFDGTIYDNITLFKNFTKSEVEWAIDCAGLRNMVEEKGLMFQCGVGGCNLSGGECQRISIARSILKKCYLLIADEATAALDVKTSYEVMNSIIELEKTTKLVITHQLDEKLLRKFEKIIVIKEGTVYEQGSFEELMNRKDYFYSLYNVS